MNHRFILGGMRYALLALLITFGLALPGHAQVDTGAIVGQVTDSAGAVISGAKVTVREENTGITNTVTASSTGNYTISPLKLGTYTLTVEKEGFKTTQRQHIEVTIQSRLEVNIPMEVGAVTQTVQVDSTAPLLETQTAAIQQLVEERAINNLPLNGRNASFLAQISPGVTFAQNDSRNLQASGSFTANGMMRNQNNYLLDGMDNNAAIGDLVNQSQYVVMPPPDALREFTVQTSNYSAEFGHSAGAVLNVSTKAGTNKFHGNLWEYLRNDIFDARDFFAKESLGPKPKFRQNQFGGTFGGPIWRDHTFFFVDYQGFRNVQGKTYTKTVPTSAERNSPNPFTNLNDLITLQATAANLPNDALGRTFKRGTVFDPATTRAVTAGVADPVTGIVPTVSGNVRDPFYTGSIVGKTNYTDSASIALLNQIPAARQNPDAVKLLLLYPEPTSTALVNNFTNNPNNVNNINSFDTRLDDQLTSRDAAFFRYSYVYNDQLNPGPFAGIADGAAARPGTGYAESQNGALSWTHILTDHLVNETRVGYSRVFDKRLQPGANTMGIPDQYGIPGVPQIPQNGGLPLFNMGNMSDLGSAGTMPSDKASNVWQITENLSVDRNKHQMRFGFEFQNVAFPMVTPTQPRGAFTHSGVFTSLTTTTDASTDRAQFTIEPRTSTVGGPNYIGGANQVQATSFPATSYPVRRYYGAYGQDSWRVTPIFTLNLGLRYEFIGVPAEINGRIGNFQSAFTGDTPDGVSRYFIPRNRLSELNSNANVVQSLTNANVVITPTSDDAIGLAQKTNFAPRIGFSYQPAAKVSVRGGYGLFYQPSEIHGLSISPYINFPFQVTNNYVSNNSVTPTTADGSVGPLSQGLTNVSLSPSAVSTLAKANALAYQGEPRYPKTTYSQSFSLQVQYQIVPSTLLFVGYVGSNSRHVQLSMPTNTVNQIRQPNTTFSTIALFPTLASGGTYLSHNGGTNYNSLQFGGERRFTNGFAFTANMTWGKCMGNVRDLLDNNIGGLRAPYVPGAGPSIDYTLCDINVKRIIHTTGTYELPFGKGKPFLQHGVEAWVTGGWSANWIFTAQDGQPLSVTCPNTTTTTLGCFSIKKPGVNPYTPYSGANDTASQGFLNPDAFATPPAVVGASTIGSLINLGGPGGQVSGPPYRRLDFSIFRKFDFIKETYFQFRAEVFNLTNTPNFGQPGTLNPVNAAFAKISTTRGNPNNSRQMQLVLKYYF